MLFRLPPRGSGCFIPPDAKNRGERTIRYRKVLEEHPALVFINEVDEELLPASWIEREIERELAFCFWTVEITPAIKRILFLFVHEVDAKEFRMLLWVHLGVSKVNKKLESWFWSIIRAPEFKWEEEMRITRTPQFKRRVARYRKVLADDRTPDGWSEVEAMNINPEDYTQYVDSENTAWVGQESSGWELEKSPLLVLFATFMALLPVPRYTETYESIYTKAYKFLSRVNINMLRRLHDDPWIASTEDSQLIEDCEDPAQAMAWVDTVREFNLPSGYEE